MAASPPPLRHVRAAQLRARAIRGAIGRVVLGSVFLVGALAFARAPDHHNQDSLLWRTGPLLLATANVAMGLRTIARVRRRPARLWIAAVVAWGLLSTVLVGFLLHG